MKHKVIPMLKTDTDVSRIDTEEERFQLDNDDINLPPPSLGETERESVPFQPQSSTKDMDAEDLVFGKVWIKTKNTVTPKIPKTKASSMRRYPGDDRSPGFDNNDVNLPLNILGRAETSSVLFQPATPSEEISEKRTPSEKDVERIVGRTPSATKVKQNANVTLSKMNTDISICEAEQERLLVLDSSVVNLDPPITAKVKSQSSHLQPATRNLESENS